MFFKFPIYLYKKVEWFETLVKGSFFISYPLNLTTVKKGYEVIIKDL